MTDDLWDAYAPIRAAIDNASPSEAPEDRITHIVIDGIRWDRYEYAHGETILQRDCPDCDRGLITGIPGVGVVFCSRCGGSGYLTARWPSEAVADPPEYPFKLDRHTYEAPGMAAWRATLHGGTTVADDDDLDLRALRRDVGTAPRPTTRPRRAWSRLLRRLPPPRRSR